MKPAKAASAWEAAHTFGETPFHHELFVQESIFSYLRYHASAHSDDPFITFVSAKPETQTLSYGRLDFLSRRLATWVRQRYVRGEVLGFLPTNDFHSVVTLFGLLRSGCPVLLLNPIDPTARIQQQTEALGVQTIFRTAAIAESIPNTVAAPEVADINDEIPLESDVTDPAADMLFLATSGSTAASKIVAQSHRNAVANAEAMRRHHGLKRGDRFLGCLPIHHVNGLHFTLFATLASGAHAIMPHAFDPFAYLRLIEQFRPRIASVVPSILEAVLVASQCPAIPSEFRYFVSAAAPLMARTARAFMDKIHVEIRQGYGLTETTNFSTTMPAELSADSYRRLMLEAEIPSIGTPVFGNEVMILAANGREAAPGDVGEVCIRGHNVMSRYVGNTEVTDEAFRGGWFHSQDLGFETKDDLGRRLFVLTGRIKNIAKVRGESVSLDEMERVLLAMKNVADAACVAVPHRLLGDEIVAAVVLSEGCYYDEIEIRTHLRVVFSESSLPRRIIRLRSIPRTPTGKIRRSELTEQLTSID